MRKKILAFVMAGGRGSRLEPLTAARSKPAVPFGGKYRIIDFVLSNMVNSGIFSIYVLTQFKSQSLTEHVGHVWNFGSVVDEHFVIPVPAQQRTGEHWYQGTADAIYQNFDLFLDHQPELVAVFGADHIFIMNVEDMVSFHLETKAAVTIAAIAVPIDQAHQFGVIQVDDHWRITGFQEKPQHPAPLPNDPTMALVSMGNYIFTSQVMIDALRKDAADGDSHHDFGQDVLPDLLNSGKALYAYDFRKNKIPGSNKDSVDFYWRDVGTLDAYFEATLDLRAVKPQLDLYNYQWPIRSASNNYPPAKFVHNAEGRVGQAIQSIVCEGTIISGSTVRDSVIGHRCRIHSFSEVDQCILMDGVDVGRGARLRHCIVDKEVQIPRNDVIGFNRDEDAKRFHVTESGLVVIPKRSVVQPSR
jgi:glucose-1-phosphate adenylyltransferase